MTSLRQASSLSSPHLSRKQAQGHSAHTQDHVQKDCQSGSAYTLVLWVAMNLV